MPAAHVLINSFVFDRIIDDPKFVAAFPFLRNPPKNSTKPCGSCGKHRQPRAVAKSGGPYDYNSLKRQVAELPADRKRLLLQLLDVLTATVCYRDQRGKMKRLELV